MLEVHHATLFSRHRPGLLLLQQPLLQMLGMQCLSARLAQALQASARVVELQVPLIAMGTARTRPSRDPNGLSGAGVLVLAA